MASYADLEIGLHRYDSESYSVEFRFSQPDSDADIRLGQGKPTLARFDFAGLHGQDLDPAAYGQSLTQGLFADPAVKTAFAQALASAQSLDIPLRLRLLIGPSAPELHELHWETLLNPQDLTPLCTNENLLFTRYLSSLDWRPVRLRPQGELKALVVVANPNNLAAYNLSPVDVDGELSRARDGLGPIAITPLPDPASGVRATLDHLVDLLSEGGHDILYLVCHGTLIKDEAWLWLEDDACEIARTRGSELVTRLKELGQRPRLVVLASCQSAGGGETVSPARTADGALAALGPRLSEAGIPAVLAMQGQVSMSTVAEFMPVFFKELARDGQIDRAMARGRGAVREKADYWMPVLFMRLKSGRIWYVPGFGEGRQAFEKWPALVRSIKRGQCTPILGSGLVEPLLGSMREIARRWAETYHYPMAPHERESLPQVAQFLTTNQGRGFPYDELEEYLRGQVQDCYSSDLPPELLQQSTPLDRLIEAVGQKTRQRDPLEPHRVLANLPLPIYISTNYDDLLSSALKEAGKDPQVVLCPWNDSTEQIESIYDKEPDYRPTPDRPLVYHLFGRFVEPDSIVLTEDNYFDFLIGMTENRELIPSAVRRALADTSLLFLGFQMDEWDFRVLFRSIISQQGGGRRDRYSHIAAQIEPEEGRILEPERARRYLENYFTRGEDIDIFWGSVPDFIKELWRSWSESGNPVSQ